ncbi:MAG: hypothetical protein ACJ73J_09620 [Actinomycetes bacterium]
MTSSQIRPIAGVLAALACAATVATVGAAVPATGSATSEAGIYTARPVAGCRVFPSNNYWNADISGLPKNRKSDAWIRHMSPRSELHPDFGRAYGDQPVPYGIPITVVGAAHRRVNVHFDYARESDRVRYPLGKDSKIEGGRRSDGDRHVIIVDKSKCRLYETWNTRKRNGHWTAGSGAVWSLKRNALRPDGWTSADAAGLPILPGLLRWSEVKRGKVDHAIRFTTDITDNRYVWPARHRAGAVNNRNYPPMGARFRLKASFDMSGYGKRARVVLRAMQKYGLVLADNGSPWYFQGEATNKWPSSLISDLKRVPARAFVAVDTSSLMVDPNSARVAPA